MTDITPGDRVIAALNQTATESLIEDAESLMTYAEEHLSGLDGEERIVQGIYHHQDLAALRLRQAEIEQQRIANLLTVALDSHSPVGTPRFNLAAREKARDMALAALGLPTGGYER